MYETHYQNNTYEITINGYQVKEINESGLQYEKPSSSLRAKLGCLSS